VPIILKVELQPPPHLVDLAAVGLLPFGGSRPVHSSPFRRIARLFASLLLLWTAVDVCDYGLCSHHRDPAGRYAQTAFRAGATAEESAPGPAGDCFCCSHLVDVRTRFRITLAYEVAWAVIDESAGEPHLTSAPWYHPPLA
jgi:hypothetical protein